MGNVLFSGYFSQVEDKNIDKEMIISCDRCHAEKALHLKTSIRSFRADKQCQFVDALLNNEPETAKEIYQYIFEKYPVYITRDANVAKNGQKEKYAVHKDVECWLVVVLKDLNRKVYMYQLRLM